MRATVLDRDDPNAGGGAAEGGGGVGLTVQTREAGAGVCVVPRAFPSEHSHLPLPPTAGAPAFAPFPTHL